MQAAPEEFEAASGMPSTCEASQSPPPDASPTEVLEGLATSEIREDPAPGGSRWEMRSMRRRIAEQEARIAALMDTLAEQDARLSKQDELLAQRDAQLADQEALLAERSGVVDNHDAQLKEQDRQLAEQARVINEQAARLNEQSTEIAALRSRCRLLEEPAEQRRPPSPPPPLVGPRWRSPSGAPATEAAGSAGYRHESPHREARTKSPRRDSAANGVRPADSPRRAQRAPQVERRTPVEVPVLAMPRSSRAEPPVGPDVPTSGASALSRSATSVAPAASTAAAEVTTRASLGAAPSWAPASAVVRAVSVAGVAQSAALWAPVQGSGGLALCAAPPAMRSARYLSAPSCWEVVAEGGVNIRRAADLSSAMVGRGKERGEIVHGAPHGDWVALSDDPGGFILISNGGKALLRHRPELSVVGRASRETSPPAAASRACSEPPVTTIPPATAPALRTTPRAVVPAVPAALSPRCRAAPSTVRVAAVDMSRSNGGHGREQSFVGASPEPSPISARGEPPESSPGCMRSLGSAWPPMDSPSASPPLAKSAASLPSPSLRAVFAGALVGAPGAPGAAATAQAASAPRVSRAVAVTPPRPLQTPWPAFPPRACLAASPPLASELPGSGAASAPTPPGVVATLRPLVGLQGPESMARRRPTQPNGDAISLWNAVAKLRTPAEILRSSVHSIASTEADVEGSAVFGEPSCRAPAGRAAAPAPAAGQAPAAG